MAVKGILSPTPYGPPVQPVLTNQQFTFSLSILSFNNFPYTSGLNGRKGAAKQVEKVGKGSLIPFSVPGALEVKPDKK